MADSKAKTPTTKDVPAEAEDQIVNAEVAEVVAEKTETSTKAPAKAGKRSAKAQEAAEEKAAKEERKAAKAEGEASDDEAPKKKPVKPTRPRVERQGKKFQEVAKLVEKDKVYSLKEAIALAGKTSPVKFDATVELHVNLNVDPRQADQNLRDNLVLPAGTGKTVRVAVFADEKVEGADLAGVEVITAALEKGVIEFDVLVSTPANMPKLGKYARLLGPRGLMPNPKSGTVTPDVAKAVQQSKAGKVEYRVDSTGIIHVGIGKVSFSTTDLESNARALLTSLKANKPGSIKGTYVKSIHLTTSMGPSIKVATNEL
nr:ribosomal protein L1 [uncultured bacterium]